MQQARCEPVPAAKRSIEQFVAAGTRDVWEAKYRLQDERGRSETTIEETWQRIARALAAVESSQQSHWERRFFEALSGFRFLPGGRIHAGAGTQRRVTLFNCFVMGTIEDSMDGIFDALKEGALTMQQGGGVGYDFSTLRPKGITAKSGGTIASGPVSFMQIWDAMCGTILSTGARRGAMMGTLRCDHPDIEEFVQAKCDARVLRHFNLSVLATDEFMQAVREGADWPLVFPAGAAEAPGAEFVERVWPGDARPRRCRVFRRVDARALWARVMRATYDCAEPGVIFIDRVRRADNLYYCESISATNPCGEIPLPPYGACDLGSINLTRFVNHPFAREANLDLEAVAATAATAVRMLDNVYDISNFPLVRQREVAQASRRVGLGITGLADAFIMLGVKYDSPRALQLAEEVMRTICLAAYRASIDLARKKGSFPLFRADDYTRSEFVARLPEGIVEDIRRYGMRNSHLTAIAPAGTISLLAGNVSSGLEPAYAVDYQRSVRLADGSLKTIPVTDYACALYRWLQRTDGGAPPAFAAAAEVDPHAQLAMQGALQPYVDNSISKTVSVPADFDFERFSDLYQRAYDLGLKGCTTYRPSELRGAVLQPEAERAAQCCSTEREAD
ncbi:MAG: adenosylcobalamin-dependent ribonucleoside-diphosphate reductase [Betaproteobacteria bacterium]|nr:adenosylcobalamin-dependent ribonucleoside-diphosphate reductase [Betaproteobacteria bacterium]